MVHRSHHRRRAVIAGTVVVSLVCLASTCWYWDRSFARHLTAVQAIELLGLDDEAAQMAGMVALSSDIVRNLDRIRTLARRQDMVGIHARNFLSRLRREANGWDDYDITGSLQGR